MYLKGRFVKYLILLSTWDVGKYAYFMQMYVYIYFGNQLTTQNNDKYCLYGMSVKGDSWLP